MGKKKGVSASSSGSSSSSSSSSSSAPKPSPPSPATTTTTPAPVVALAVPVPVAPLGGRAANKKDPSTLSNYEEIRSQHLKLQLEVDFAEQVLKGWAEHTMRALTEMVTRAVFDTSAGLLVEKVEVDGVEAAFRALEPHPVLGTPLEVSLPTPLPQGKTSVVKLHYRTSRQASACQWLPPEQTAGRRYPYLFTQSQAIHARSIFPCQDAPAVKMTYAAKIRAPSWATVLMSALRQEEKETVDGSGRRTFVWEQPVSTPSYLVALAVGDLEARDISPRCRVWAEPSVVQAAKHEFAQTEEFLQAAESVAGCDYVWTRYDILCLPPSFPYGGMENPCLTFATPTLLAGDRSLADVIAHEIAHSWSGNLVTNHTWEHFWLNEGWTMWIQRKVMARIHNDPKIFDLDAACIGWPHLEESVAAFKDHPQLTALVPDIDGVDPDDAFSSVPYEKGFSLLVMLEQIVGTPAFEAFAQAYIRGFRYKTVTSDEFRSTLLSHFNNDPRLLSLPWADLFYTPGLPPKPTYDTAALAAPSLQLADAWHTSNPPETSDDPFPQWPTLQRQIFLERLLARAEKEGPMPVPVLESMDRRYSLSATRNSEIRFRWAVLCIRAGAAFIVSNALDLATTQGRMKFTRPLYKELHKSPMARQLAVDTFKRHAGFYHPICRRLVAGDLGLKLGADGSVVDVGGGGEGGVGGEGPGGREGAKGVGKGKWEGKGVKGWVFTPVGMAVVVGVAAVVAVGAVRASKRR